MRTLILILLSYTSFAQPANQQAIYSLHTRLGMNGPVKSVTAYKYTRLKYTEGKDTLTTGTLYSVIKNEYDTAGLIIHDSTVTFYGPKNMEGYCKDYTYNIVDSTPVIQIFTHYDCVPYHDNKPPQETIVVLSSPSDSMVLAREYYGNTLPQRGQKFATSYRFTLRDGLIQKTYFEAYVKRRKQYGTTTYEYDQYNNFTQTTITVGEAPKQVVHHKISTIDDYGNALHMLNFINKDKEPEFMTIYQFEYYK